MVGLDAAILMHPRSGRPAATSPSSPTRWWTARPARSASAPTTSAGRPSCPDCGGELTEPRQFNLMFKTFMGPVEDDAAVVYLRPETAQGIFVNFENVLQSMRKKLPFGIAQIGKSFRNEITPGNFIFRDREFEQMEIEFFVKPGTDEEWYEHWIRTRAWTGTSSLGISPEQPAPARARRDELAHYAKAAFDIEYLFPLGWGELEGIANRTDYDLKRHGSPAGKDLTYFDEETNEHVIPYVIEPSAGVDRTFLVVLLDAYHEEQVRNEKRVVLKFSKPLAPDQGGGAAPAAQPPRDRGAGHGDRRRPAPAHAPPCTTTPPRIGRLYRRQDEIGTPVLRHRRRPVAGRQGRDHPRPRHHGAGARARRRAARRARGQAGPKQLITQPRGSQWGPR